MPTIINKIVKTLIASDFFLNLGWGLLSPVFALFILENITVGNSAKAAEVAGLSALSYWISKSFIEIPIGRFLDKTDGETDDFWFLVIGTLITALVPLGFLFSSSPWHIYFLQVIHAVGMAMSLPSWLAIFTRHIDKGKEAFEWSLESTSIGIGAGVAGGLGGMVVALFGFEVLFYLVTLLTTLTAVFLLFIRKEISKNSHRFKIPLQKPVVES